MLGFIVPIRLDKNQNHAYFLWLERALELGIQVILIFDGAGAISIKDKLDQIKVKYPKLLVTDRVEVGNPGEARNKGLDLIQSDWIAFIDSDDFVHCDRYLDLLSSMQLSKKLVGVGNFISTTYHSSEFSNVRSRRNSVYSRIKFPGLWRYIFSKDRIGSLEFRNSLGGEDIAFLCDLNLKMSELHVSHEVIYHYNQNVQGQLTRTQDMYHQLSRLIDSMPPIFSTSKFGLTFSFFLRVQLRGQYIVMKIRNLGRSWW
jgi:glycosyltransferase involved in cell wall biosynthesis